MLRELSSALDRIIGVFSPESEAKRIWQRSNADRARQYAAAKYSRSTGSWSPANSDVNTLIRSSSAIVRARSRQLVRDFAYFARAIDILVDYTVGSGIQLQSRVSKNVNSDSKPELDTKTIRSIEEAWEIWKGEADAAGRLHYHEIEQLAKRQDVESGEFIIVKNIQKDRNRFLPYSLAIYEADWLNSSYATAEAGNIVDQGVEFEPITGKVIAYHFAIPDGYNPLFGSVRTKRVLAENVIHGFKTLRPGQLRGITPFTTAILIADDLHEYLNAEIDGAKSAAKYLAFVESSDPAMFQALRSNIADTGEKIESLQNAMIEYLRPGEKINLASHNRPGNSFVPFTQLVLRMVAISTGVTYELLTGDYEGINYSNLRGIRNDFQKMIQPLQQRHINQFCKPIFADFLYYSALSGRLNLPGYFANPRPYQAAVWQPPGVESIDPLREGKAYIDQIGSLLRSPQEVTTARGRDYEDVLNEIAEAKRMAEARGLTAQDVNTKLASAPGAVVDEPKPNTPTKKRNIDDISERTIQTPPQPIINITIPEQSAPVVNVQNDINIPEQPAPNITVTLPDQPTPSVNITIPEQPVPVVNVQNDISIPEQPVPVVNVQNDITMPQPPEKQIKVTRDSEGKITGAEIK